MIINSEYDPPALRGFILVLSALLISACTQSGDTVETALSQQATQSEQSQNFADNQQVAANALSAEVRTSSDSAISSQQNAPQTAAVDPANSFAFLPLEGVPQSASTSLSRSLRANGQDKGLSLVPTNQTSAQYKVKGYFSALSDGSGTLLVYVWDVIDASGKRVHRINGQERSTDSNTNPWQSITDEELGNVADRTTTQLKSWIETRRG